MTHFLKISVLFLILFSILLNYSCIQRTKVETKDLVDTPTQAKAGTLIKTADTAVATDTAKHPGTPDRDSAVFTTEKLPRCIEYTEASAFISDADKHGYDFFSFIKKNKKYLRGKTKMTESYIKRFLFSNSDSVDIINPFTGEYVHKKFIDDYLSENDFYLLDTIVTATSFYALAYERVEYEGSVKYLATFDKTGKLIARLQVAYYMHRGSYTADDGSRPPWYAEMTACIDKKLVITTDEQGTYIIEPDGKFVQRK